MLQKGDGRRLGRAKRGMVFPEGACASSLSLVGQLFVDYAPVAKAVNKIFARRTRDQTSQLRTRLFESVHSFDPERVTIG